MRFCSQECPLPRPIQATVIAAGLPCLWETKAILYSTKCSSHTLQEFYLRIHELHASEPGRLIISTTKNNSLGTGLKVLTHQLAKFLASTKNHPIIDKHKTFEPLNSLLVKNDFEISNLLSVVPRQIPVLIPPHNNSRLPKGPCLVHSICPIPTYHDLIILPSALAVLPLHACRSWWAISLDPLMTAHCPATFHLAAFSSPASATLTLHHLCCVV